MLSGKIFIGLGMILSSGETVSKVKEGEGGALVPSFNS